MFFISTFAEAQNKSSSTINSTDVDILFYKASTLYNQQKFDESLQYLDKVLEIEPIFIDAINGKAIVLANLDKNQEALPLIQSVLESNPNNEYYLSTAAIFIMYNLGKYDDVKIYYEKSLKINPNLTSILSEKELTAFNKLMNNNTKQ